MSTTLLALAIIDLIVFVILAALGVGSLHDNCPQQSGVCNNHPSGSRLSVEYHHAEP